MSQEMTAECYACIDRNSTAITRCYFTHPACANVSMHATCYVELSGWAETNRNLSWILLKWNLCVLRARRQRRVQRAQLVMELVSQWRFESVRASVHKRLCRVVFTQWSSYAVPPALTHSSDDFPAGNDHADPSDLADSSDDPSDLTDSSDEVTLSDLLRPYM
jgi:hypothetical protein